MRLNMLGAGLLGASLAWGGVGCGKKEAPPAAAIDAAGAPSEPGGAPSEPGGARRAEERDQPRRGIEGAEVTQEGVLASPALRYVPKTTSFLVMARLGPLLKTLGYADGDAGWGRWIAEPVAAAVEAVGLELGTLEAWAALGVDLDRASGVFLTGPDEETAVGFLSLKDAKRFTETLLKIAKRLDKEAEPRVERVGEAELLELAGGAAAVAVVEGTALVAVDWGAEAGAARRHLEDVLGMGEADRLGGAGLVALADGVAAPLGVLYGRVVLPEGREDEEAVVSRQLWGGEVRALVGLDVRADAVEFQSRIALGDGAKWNKLLVNMKDVGPLARLTNVQPLSAGLLQVDVLELIDVWQAWGAQGEPPLAEARQAAKELLGLDLDTQILEALNGEIAWSVAWDPTGSKVEGDATGGLAVTVALGTKGEREAKGLLALAEGLEKREELQEVVAWNAEAEVLTVGPIDGTMVQVGRDGSRIVIGTGATSLVRGDGWAKSLQNRTLAALMARPGAAALSVVQAVGLGGYLGASNGLEAPSFEPSADPKRQALIDEYHQIVKELQELEAKRRAEEEELQKGMGSLALRLQGEAGGMRASLGVYPEGMTVKEWIARWLALIGAREQGEGDRREGVLWERRYQIERLLELSVEGK